MDTSVDDVNDGVDDMNSCVDDTIAMQLQKLIIGTTGIILRFIIFYVILSSPETTTTIAVKVECSV